MKNISSSLNMSLLSDCFTDVAFFILEIVQPDMQTFYSCSSVNVRLSKIQQTLLINDTMLQVSVYLGCYPLS